MLKLVQPVMETDYLQLINEELFDISEFFIKYHAVSGGPTFPMQNAHAIAPLLKTDLTLEDQYVADLRDRYKQLKAIQDQLFLELTRSHILKQSMMRSTENGAHADANSLPSETKTHSDSMMTTPSPKLKPTPSATTLPVTPDVSNSQNKSQNKSIGQLLYRGFQITKSTAYNVRHSPYTPYILLMLGLFVIIGGWLDNNEYNQTSGQYYQSNSGCHFRFKAPGEDRERYPWPRH
ncbi:hypothetical protein FBU30_003970 [Linnemannia zychae]|nr:hypothetical protein FBU30_003970 [Linnemannia zychae]